MRVKGAGWCLCPDKGESAVDLLSRSENRGMPGLRSHTVGTHRFSLNTPQNIQSNCETEAGKIIHSKLLTKLPGFWCLYSFRAYTKSNYVS